MDLLTGLFLGSQLMQLVGTFGASNALSGGYSDASQAVANAGKYGIDLQMDMFNQSLDAYKPYTEAGTNALQTYQDIQLPSTTVKYAFDPNDETYKLQKEELEKNVNRYYASRGLYDSRPAVNTLADQNRKLIAQSTEDQYKRGVDQYNRDYQNSIADLNKYGDLVNSGVSATNAIANLAASTGRGIAEVQQSIGNAQSQAALGQGQNKAGMWQDLAGASANALSQYYLLNKLSGGKLIPTLGSGTTPAATNALTTGATGTGVGTVTAIEAAEWGGAGAETAAAMNEITAGSSLYTGANAPNIGAAMSSNAAMGTIGAGIMAAPVLGPIVAPAFKDFAQSLGMGKTTAPGASNYLNALTGAGDQYGGETAAIDNLLKGYAANPGGYTRDPVEQIRDWLVMDRYGQWQAPEGGEQSYAQWLNQVPLSEAQTILDKYKQAKGIV